MRMRRAAIFGAGAFAAAMLLAIGLECTALADDACPNFNHGCYASTTVPCSGATCASIFDHYPEPPPLGGCADLAAPTYFTATAVLSWNKCQENLTHGPPPYNIYDYNACLNSANVLCADVLLYKTTPCNQANYCDSSFFSACGSSGGAVCRP